MADRMLGISQAHPPHVRAPSAVHRCGEASSGDCAGARRLGLSSKVGQLLAHQTDDDVEPLDLLAERRQLASALGIVGWGSTLDGIGQVGLLALRASWALGR
jgi:hypothetical protein